jgi:hypothetical protein
MAVQLAGAVTEAGGQAAHPFPVDDAVADQPHRPTDDVGPHVPQRAARSRLGSAAPAGPEAGTVRGRGSREEADVLPLRAHGRAARPAVDAGGGHREEERPVEPGVPAGHRVVLALPRRHDPTIDDGQA